MLAVARKLVARIGKEGLNKNKIEKTMAAKKSSTTKKSGGKVAYNKCKRLELAAVRSSDVFVERLQGRHCSALTTGKTVPATHKFHSGLFNNTSTIH